MGERTLGHVLGEGTDSAHGVQGSGQSGELGPVQDVELGDRAIVGDHLDRLDRGIKRQEHHYP
jgi:hypothetical protein